MGTLPAAQAHQLSASQRSTIRQTVQDAIARYGVEWAMRHTCVELQEKYGLSKDTVEYLLHGELPSTLPEELLSAGQKHRLRRDFHEANSIPDSAQKESAVAAVFSRYQGLYGVSEATLQAVVGPECERVGSTERPPGEQPMPVAPSLPEPGQAVEVRGSAWAVAHVQAQGLPLSPADDAAAQLNHVVDLQSLDEDRLGEQFRPDRPIGIGDLCESVHRVVVSEFLDSPNCVRPGDPDEGHIGMGSGNLADYARFVLACGARRSPKPNHGRFTHEIVSVELVPIDGFGDKSQFDGNGSCFGWLGGRLCRYVPGWW